jgi:hypothetical protein
VIGGYTPDNPVDAAIVGYYEGDKPMFVSKVRNGFVPRFTARGMVEIEAPMNCYLSLCKPAGGETHAVGLIQETDAHAGGSDHS